MRQLVKSEAQNVIMALLSTAIFTLSGVFVLANGQLHEDAYILFIYAENLAKFGEIVYYSGGPSAEGATDFLWMILLAGANLFGIDSGSAALLLNGIGIFWISYLISGAIRHAGGGWVVQVIFAFLVPTCSIAMSSLNGFSTGLYSALSLSLFWLLWRAEGRRMTLIPVVAIILGLFRPDGVIVGVLATLIGYFQCDAQHRPRFALTALAAMAVGIVYFIWRWNYFGEFLPLPLQVKSVADTAFPGLWSNYLWIKSNTLLMIASVFYVVWKDDNRKRLLVATVPTAALLVALIFATQSQNVSFRFQAPFSAILLLLSAALVSSIWFSFNRRSYGHAVLGSAVAMSLIWQLGYQIKDSEKTYAYLRADNYINFFPYHLKDHVGPDASIALTEAGRMAYWLPGQKHDLVGLNTAYTAKYGADPEYIDSLDPDFIFFHTAGVIEIPCDDRDFCELPFATFQKIVEDARLKDFSETPNRVGRAALATLTFLTSRPDEYRIFVTRYASRFVHLHALKHEGAVPVGPFLKSLRLSYSRKGRLSYYEMKSRP